MAACGKEIGLSKSEVKKAFCFGGSKVEKSGDVVATLPDWLINWIYVEKLCEFANTKLNYSIKREAFNAKYNRKDDVKHAEMIAFKEIKRVLTSQGYALFATLSEGSLFELREAWAAVDEHEHINRFMPESVLRSVLQQAGVQCKTWQVKRHVMYYPDVNGVLQSLKRIGASQVNGQRSQGLLTRQKLLVLQQAYERYRLPSGLLPVTYNVCYGVLHR